MSFELLHKVVTYILMGCGLASISFSGELPAWVTWMAVVGIGITWFLQAPKMEKTPMWWFGGLLAAFFALLALAMRSGEWLESTIAFAVVMVVSKLFQRRVARDFYQLYTLSFLLIVGGAVMNPGVSFAITFLLYIIVLTLGLVLLHLRRDLEERTEAQEQLSSQREGGDVEAGLWRARDLVTRRFLTGTSMLALGVFAASIFIFFLFPRVGFGFFFSRSRPGPSVAGFSSRVELGHFGKIKDDPTVVARVELPDEDGPIDEPLRLRGISFDTYDGKRWTRETGSRGRTPMRTGPRGVRLVDRSDPMPEGTRTLKQRVYLEPLRMDVRPIFGNPSITEFYFDDSIFKTLAGTKRRFYQSFPSEDLSYDGPEKTSFFYTVISEIVPKFPRGIRGAGNAYPPGIEKVYLQLPEKLRPEIGGMAIELTQGMENPFDRALAIERHLSTEFTYSLEGEKDPIDPLADFLLKSQSGHCEYFASGMVILLRTLGIPARMANGFYGGVWNDFGQYYAVRQGDAHAWVEVYFPGYGWLTFEPTPASGALAPNQTDWATEIQSWMDSMKLQWFKWVIEYDLEKQVDMFRKIGRNMADLGGISDSNEREDKTEALRDLFDGLLTKRNIFGSLLILAFFFLAYLGWTRASAVRGTSLSADQAKSRKAWQEWKKWIAFAGESAQNHQNPDEVARSMKELGWKSWRHAEILAECIQEVRFGNRPWSEHNRVHVEEALAEIQNESKARKREKSRRAA